VIEPVRRFFVSALLVAAVACSRENAAPAVPAEPPPGAGVTIEFSDKPVALAAFAIKDLDGRPIDRAGWAGKVVLLNFWATWCGPCREEIPDLIALQNKYRDQLIVVGLSVDEGPAADVKAFADAHQINYPISIVGKDVETLFGGIHSVPSTFIVNTTGGIVQRHVGLLKADVTEQEVRSLAGLPTAATVKIVPDTGQVLLANSAYATEIPGVDLSGLSPAKKVEALKRLNTEKCSCGCGLTLAQCRINDPSCDISPGIAAKLVKAIRRGN
jgi:thiol-disulfide isomerase/thioredoxin